MCETKKSVHPRKTEIVRAAVTCFLERGYHQTGVRDIAKQAGVSLGNLYNHFKGKEAVLAYIAEIEGEELSEFVTLLSEPDDPLAALERFVAAYASYAALPENALLGAEILTEALRNPLIAEVFGKNRKQLIDAIVTCLDDGAKSGVFVAYDAPDVAACMLLDALEGNGLRQLSKRTNDEKSAQTLQAVLINSLKP